MEHTNISANEHVKSMHRFGTLCCVIVLAIMFAMPVIAGAAYNAHPNFTNVFAVSAGLLGTFFPVALSEVISYSPVLGSSTYLTFITGNVTNLKVPAAATASQLVDAQPGSEDADVIAGIAVSISTFTSILILALGVLLMIPLQPVLGLPAVKTATSYIIPALYGTMAVMLFNPNLGGGLSSPNRMKGAVPGVVLVAAACLLDKYLFHTGFINSYTGVVIICLLPILYFSTKWMYGRGMITVHSAANQTAPK